MPSIIKKILAIIVGVIVGMFINGFLIKISPNIIAPPPGVNVNDEASLRAGIHLFQAKHFIMPFLAHALGTLAGAYLAARIAPAHKLRMALIIGLVFLAGGIWMSFLIPAPTWFIIADLLLAYLPMAWLGWRLAK